MWYLLTTRHLRCVSEMREGRGGSQTSSTVGTFKYLTLTLTWQDLQGGKCKGVWKKSAYQPVSNSAKDTDTDKSSKCPLRFTNCLTLLCSSYDSQMCLQSETILQKISSHLPVGPLQRVEARCRDSSISLRPRQYTTLVGLYPCAGSISLWPRQYTTRQHSATQIRSSELLSPAKSLLSPARVQHMIVSTQIGACANIVCTPLRILSRLV